MRVAMKRGTTVHVHEGQAGKDGSIKENFSQIHGRKKEGGSKTSPLHTVHFKEHASIFCESDDSYKVNGKQFMQEKI